MYNCSGEDLGSTVKCEISSQEQEEFPGTAILQIGQIKLDSQIRARLENILDLQQFDSSLLVCQQQQKQMNQSQQSVFSKREQNQQEELKIDFKFGSRQERDLMFLGLKTFMIKNYLVHSKVIQNLDVFNPNRIQLKNYQFFSAAGEEKIEKNSNNKTVDNEKSVHNQHIVKGDLVLEIMDMKEEINQLIQQVIVLQRENSESKSEIQRLEEEMQSTIQAYTNLIKEFKDGNGDSQNFKKQMMDFSQIIDNSNKSQLQKIKSENMELKKTLNGFELDLQEEKNLIQQLRKENEGLKQLMKKLENNGSSQSTMKLDNFLNQNQNQNIENELKKLKEQYDMEKSNNYLLLKEIAKFQQNPQYQSKEIKDAEGIILKRQIESLQAQLDFEKSKQKSGSNYVHQMRNLEEQLLLSNKENEELKIQLTSQHNNNYNKNVESIKRTAQFYNSGGKNSLVKSNSLYRENFFQNEKIHENSMNLGQILQENQELKQKIEQINGRNEVLTSQIRALQSEKERILIGSENQNSRTPVKPTLFQYQSDSYQKRIDFLENQVQQYKQQLQYNQSGQQQQEFNQVKQSEVQQGQNFEAQEQVQKLKKKIELLEKQVQALKQENELLKNNSYMMQSNILQESQLYGNAQEIRNLEQKINESKNLNKQLTSELQNYKNKLSDLQNKFEKQSYELKYLKNQTQEITSQSFERNLNTNTYNHNSYSKNNYSSGNQMSTQYMSSPGQAKLLRENESLLEQRNQLLKKVQSLQKELENQPTVQNNQKLENILKNNEKLLLENAELMEANRKLQEQVNDRSVLNQSVISHDQTQAHYQQMENMNELLMKQLDEYKRQLLELRKQQSNSSFSKQDDKRQLTELKEKCQNQHKEIRQLKEKLEKVNNNSNILDSLNGDLYNSRNNNVNQIEVVEKYRKEIKLQKQQIDKLMKSYDELINENNDLMSENRELQDQIFELKNKSVNLSQQNNSYFMSQNNQKVQELEEKLTESERLLKIEKFESQKLKRQIESLQNENIQLKKKSNSNFKDTEIKQEMQRLQKDLDDNQQIIKQLQGTNQRLIDENFSLSDQLKKVQEELDMKQSFVSRKSFANFEQLQLQQQQVLEQDNNFDVNYLQNQKFNEVQKNSQMDENKMFQRDIDRSFQSRASENNQQQNGSSFYKNQNKEEKIQKDFNFENLRNDDINLDFQSKKESGNIFSVGMFEKILSPRKEEIQNQNQSQFKKQNQKEGEILNDGNFEDSLSNYHVNSFSNQKNSNFQQQKQQNGIPNQNQSGYDFKEQNQQNKLVNNYLQASSSSFQLGKYDNLDNYTSNKSARQ
ncbi:hypothetical protein PPERSA_10863 [Pseudocohnilembus persalinus]|uniref:Uncharacterized protein n=1 Tax=Pseudocohnilembus persalinus TaxID=266149 RepID=A0A0V0QDU9_PSEPJ|nr:hypothetical protein PPERSA_10863 [Pseudocohnilembus persalinus]|eukprot:KRX00364.1 hypothetical protein PPERSA_10863 [Pseudocohnilembus persalinus]